MKLIISTLILLLYSSVCFAGYGESFTAAVNASRGNNNQQQQQQQQVIFTGDGNNAQIYNALNNMNSTILQLQNENMKLRNQLYQLQQRLTNIEMQIWDRK